MYQKSYEIIESIEYGTSVGLPIYYGKIIHVHLVVPQSQGNHSRNLYYVHPFVHIKLHCVNT